MSSYIGITTPADAATPITASISDNGVLLSTITTGYQSISVQLTGAWQATVTFQASNDNTNWVNIQGYGYNTGLNSVEEIVGTDIVLFPVIGLYFRGVVSDYLPGGPVVATAYLRQQSLDGIAQAGLSQALDDTTGVTQNVKFPGYAGIGQRPQAQSIGVALPPEQMLDQYIIGRQYTTSSTAGSIASGVNLILDGPSSITPGTQVNFTDCLQYRSIALTITQSASLTAGAVTFEASNDGVNWLAYPLYNQSTTSLVYGSQTTSATLSTTAGQTLYYAGPIQYRYFRARVSSTITSTSTVTTQAFTTLRMTPFTQSTVGQFNLSQIGSAGLTSQGGTPSGPPLLIGGVDSTTLMRRILTDTLGSVSIVPGQQAANLEQQLPLQVQEYHSTRGQDSTQDLLAQILNELKVMNYYTKELPMAINYMQQQAGLSINNPLGADEPERFYSDPTINNLK